MNTNMLNTIDLSQPTPDIESFFNHLKSLGLDSDYKDLAMIEPFVTKKSFKKGDSILKIGEICRDIFFVAKGLSRSYLQLPNGTEKTYLIFLDNVIFTDQISFMAQKPATENIEAIEDMEVYCITYDNLMYLYKTYHSWETLGRNISDFNFIFTQKRLRSMMNDDAGTRYIKFMKYFGTVSHRIPQHIIASYLGITPQSLSRLKKK